MTESPSIWRQQTQYGIWSNNPGTNQLLGLCPLLAVTTTVSNAIGLALATILVLIASNASISALRSLIPKHIRIPVFVLIIASWVTVTLLLLQAYAFSLYQTLGLFLALITTNCTVLARAEAFASRQSTAIAAWDGLMQGIGFAWVLILMGFIRELIGSGTLFTGINNWLPLPDITITMSNHYEFLLLILPPGAFIIFGLIIACKQALENKTKKLVNRE